ncbi:hypothetical protein CCACVL1_19511 [Corchorus capsularis]|uniref:Uncharacterized protein n=1 Tax=Corchorus capsularis TaxID=210143 RepID=A0A1R3HGL1_COCAP|nr:hypothetical protein CCACVL1_19511 [Corchorus capsularis]
MTNSVEIRPADSSSGIVFLKGWNENEPYTSAQSLESATGRQKKKLNRRRKIWRSRP